MRRLLVGFSVVLLAAGVLAPAAAVAPSSTGAAPVAGTVVRTPADANGPAVTRYFGATRSDTAGLLARDGFVGADTILLARQDNFPDSLGGGFLAGHLGAPVVLTATDALSPEAQAVIDDVKPTNVVILGGLTAVSQAVQDSVAAQGLTVTRLAGEGRYDTGAALATAPGTSVGSLDGKKTAILASGRNFPDALVMSALAYAKGWPLLLTEPGALVPQTSRVLTDLGIERVLIAGGNVAVAPDTAAAVAALGIEVTRLSGETRVDTGVAIASFAVAQAGLDPTTVNLATGRAFPDALALGPLAGTDPSPVLLTNGTDDLGGASIETYLGGLTCVTGIRVSGGTGALSDSLVAGVRTRVADADDCVTPSPTPTTSGSPSPSPTPSTPACDDDIREDDDTRATATPITSGQVITGITCPDDVNAGGFVDDWFTIDALPGQTISAVLEFDDSTSNLDLAVQDSRGFGDGVAGTSDTDDEIDELLLDLDLQPPYLIRVTDVDQRGNDYTLTVTVDDPTCPEDDVFEDNDTFGSAVEIVSGTTLRGVTCSPSDDHPETSGPEDLFILDVTPGDLLTINTSSDDVDGLFNFPYRTDATSLLASEGGALAGEPLLLNIPVGFTPQAIVDVALTNERTEALYTLDVTVTPPNCATNDPFEDNDAPGEAFPMPFGAFNDILCDADSPATDPSDYFAYNVTPGQTVTATLSSPSIHDFTLNLADDNGVVDLNSGNGGGLGGAFTVSGAIGTHVARVLASEFDPGDAPYSLDVFAEGPSCPDDDAFEDDDTKGTANVTAGSSFRTMALCFSDEDDGGVASDWTEVAMTPGQILDVTVSTAADRDDIVLRVETESGAGFVESTTLDGFAYRRTEYNGQGDKLFVQVRTTGGSVVYDVDIEVISPSCPEDDIYEPNDDFGTADTSVGFGPTLATLCAPDVEDWFVLPTIGFSTQTIEVNGVGDDLFQFSLWDKNGNQVASTSASATPSVSTQIDTALEPYRMRVLGFDGVDVEYSFSVDVFTTRRSLRAR